MYKTLSSPFLLILLFREACLDLPISLTCWALAGVLSSCAMALVPAVWVPARGAHSCLRGPAYRRPVASSPRSRGHVRAWKENMNWMQKRHQRNGGEDSYPQSRRQSQQNPPVFWPGPLLSSVSPAEKEKKLMRGMYLMFLKRHHLRSSQKSLSTIPKS